MQALLPADPDGKRLCAIFGQYRWKPITADLPDDFTNKPEWRTQSNYPIRPRVLWNRWQDANTLIGVRFGPTTCYALIDIDAGGAFCNAKGVADIRHALETIGIVRSLLLRSSWTWRLCCQRSRLVETITANGLSVRATLRKGGVSIWRQKSQTVGATEARPIISSRRLLAMAESLKDSVERR